MTFPLLTRKLSAKAQELGNLSKAQYVNIASNYFNCEAFNLIHTASMLDGCSKQLHNIKFMRRRVAQLLQGNNDLHKKLVKINNIYFLGIDTNEMNDEEREECVMEGKIYWFDPYRNGNPYNGKFEVSIYVIVSEVLREMQEEKKESGARRQRE